MDWLKSLLERFWAWWHRDLKVVQAEGDTLPQRIPSARLVHMLDAGASWSVGFRCPCGCGDVIELLLLSNVNPHWKLSVDRLGRPTLNPSVWRSTGCKAHFWLKNGRAIWVEPKPRR